MASYAWDNLKVVELQKNGFNLKCIEQMAFCECQQLTTFQVWTQFANHRNGFLSPMRSAKDYALERRNARNRSSSLSHVLGEWRNWTCIAVSSFMAIAYASRMNHLHILSSRKQSLQHPKLKKIPLPNRNNFHTTQ